MFCIWNLLITSYRANVYKMLSCFSFFFFLIEPQMVHRGGLNTASLVWYFFLLFFFPVFFLFRLLPHLFLPSMASRIPIFDSTYGFIDTGLLSLFYMAAVSESYCIFKPGFQVALYFNYSIKLYLKMTKIGVISRL